MPLSFSGGGRFFCLRSSSGTEEAPMEFVVMALSPLLFDTGHKTTVAKKGQVSSYTRCIGNFPSDRALVRPTARHNLSLRIELHSVFAQCMQITEERILPAGEREERHRRRHTHVDSDHPCCNVLGKLPRGAARAGKD